MTCTPTDTDRVHYTVDRLKEATDFLSMRPEQSKLLEELYHIREQEQQFEEGGIGNSAFKALVRKTADDSHRRRYNRLRTQGQTASAKD